MSKSAVAFVVLVIAYAIFWPTDEEIGRRPTPYSEPSPGSSAELEGLPGPASGDPIVVVEPDEPCPEACRGSAFAIDESGHYLTARHVILGCSDLDVVKLDGTRIPVRETLSHAEADLSLLTTRAAADTALPLNLTRLSRDQTGFHYGFPGGQSGDVHSLLLGRAWTRQKGVGAKRAPVVAWAEVERNPQIAGSLAGISGGAVLDAKGAVVGVTILEAPRRGRVFSVAPESIDSLLQSSGLGALRRATVGSGGEITASSFAQIGRQLRTDDRVVRVYCWA